MTLTIFLVFFRISLLSFGGVYGVLPELERMVVQEQGWLTSEKFLQAWVIGQFLPGPNMAMCPLVGWWVGGWKGFLAAFAGIYSGPLLVMSAAYALWSRGRRIEWVQRLERGVRPVVLGLLASAALRVWWVQTADTSEGWLLRGYGILLVWASYLLVRKGKISALPMLFLAGAVWAGAVWGLTLR